MEAYAEVRVRSPPFGSTPRVARSGGTGAWGVLAARMAADALREDPLLDHVKDYVEDSGEGRWTVVESVERAVPAPVLALALQSRFRSRQPSSFAAKLLAALRNKFGGHPVKTA